MTLEEDYDPADMQDTEEPPSYHLKVEEIAEIIGEIGNDWEIGFIESMQSRSDFTEKMKEVIDKLYEKACASGL